MNKMNKNEYVKELLEGYQYEIKTVDKINTSYTGAVIKIDSGLSASFNVDNMYKAYIEGADIEDQKERIRNDLSNGNPGETLNPAKTMKKENLFVAVCNYEKNKDIIDNIPHYLLTDLAIYLRLKMEIPGQLASAVVDKGVLDFLGLTEKEAFDEALKNVSNINPTIYGYLDPFAEPTLGCGLSSILRTYDKVENMNTDNFMQIVTNKDLYYGAAAIADPEVMEGIRSVIGNFYVLPSSINEIILIPEILGADEDMLRSIIREVNATAVSEDDFLSDNLYYYNGELSIAA